MTILRFAAVMLAALSMALAFSHLMQLPPRMSFDGATWMTTQRLFPLYGSVGAFIEVGALVVAGTLPYAARLRPGFRWTLVGSICLAAALAVWVGLVLPANAEIAEWTAGSIPADWTKWRAQWEYAHAARAVLLIVGLGLLVQSVLAEANEARAAQPRR